YFDRIATLPPIRRAFSRTSFGNVSRSASSAFKPPPSVLVSVPRGRAEPRELVYLSCPRPAPGGVSLAKRRGRVNKLGRDNEDLRNGGAALPPGGPLDRADLGGKIGGAFAEAEVAGEEPSPAMC